MAKRGIPATLAGLEVDMGEDNRSLDFKMRPEQESANREVYGLLKDGVRGRTPRETEFFVSKGSVGEHYSIL